MQALLTIACTIAISITLSIIKHKITQKDYDNRKSIHH